MPYVQLRAPHDLNEADIPKALEELRDHFPLQQSGGTFFRLNRDSVLFEQPEHSSLTLEQVIWLEERGYDPFVCARFYQDRTEGCRICGTPFDAVPEGYLGGFGCLHLSNPSRFTTISLPCSDDTFLAIQFLARHVYGSLEILLLREIALTLVDLLAHEPHPSLVAHVLTPQTLSSAVEHVLKTTHCFSCKQPYTDCTCPRQTMPLEVPLTHGELAHLHALAQRYERPLPTLLLRALGSTVIQNALLSRNAARGHVLSCDFAWYVPFLAQPYEPFVQIGKKRFPNVVSFGPPNGPQIPANTYHHTLQALLLADALPLLSDQAIALLTGLRHTTPSSSPLAWCKAQLEQHDLATLQQCRPCTEDHLAELERLTAHCLPLAYTEFLRWMGQGAGPFLQYLSCFFPAIVPHQQAARMMLTQDVSPATLPDDAFVFHLHAGDHFVFFRVSEGEDPPVYAHKRDWRIKPFQKIFYHFSDFLAVQLALYLTYQRPAKRHMVPNYADSHDRFLAMQERVQSTLRTFSREP